MLDVTVHTRSLAYDLQLPCTIPVQRITADVIAWINAYASDDSGLDPHRKYSLETTTGESLQESGTLAGLNIRHGTHLHLKEVDDAPQPDTCDRRYRHVPTGQSWLRPTQGDIWWNKGGVG